MNNRSKEVISIYILRLEEGKYYVGQSIDPLKRFKMHMRKNGGSEWTKKYKPIEILKKGKTIYSNARRALKVENRITLECVKKYGWQNVRGGDYIDQDEYQHLAKLIQYSGLSKEVCPVPINHGIEVLNAKRCISTLELEGGHYFVHSTWNLNFSIYNELTGIGSAWTKRFKPVRLVRVVYIKGDEDNLMLHLQELKRAFLEYHYANVRGGNFIAEEEDVHREMVFCAMGLMME